MNISGSEIVTTGAHVVALVAGAFVMRGKLIELIAELVRVGVKVTEMYAGWATNREVGQQRDKLLEALGGKIDENTRETRTGFDRLEQRLGIQDLKISAIEEKLSAALLRIAALEAKS